MNVSALGLTLRLAIVLVLSGSGAVAAPQQTGGGTFDAHVAAAKAAMLGSPMQAQKEAEYAARIAKSFSPDRKPAAIATAEWLQGEAYLRMNDVQSARPLIDHALATINPDRHTSKLAGDLLLSQGGLRTQVADVSGALQSYQKAFKVFHEIGEIRSEAIAIISIGVLYTEAADYRSALRYFMQSREIYSGDPQLLLSVHSNSAVSLQELNRLPEAQAEFRKALAIAKSLGSPALVARTYRNIARGYLLSHRVDLANKAIADGMVSARGEDGEISRLLPLMAWSAHIEKHDDRAEKLIRRFFDTVDPHASSMDLREGHQVAYDIYKAAGEDALALQHLEALKELDDKTSTLAASANTALAAARFDFANQELKIEKLRRAQLQRDIDDAALRARTQRTIFGGLAIAGGIIVGMLVFGLITIRRSRNEVRDANVDLAETNAALGKALAAKTEFLATTSHEIRTPLNGILGMTQVMLADPKIDPAVRDRITVVHGAGVTMRALVDDILDVAKMETGNLTIEAVSFDLRATLRDVSRLWEDQSRTRGVAFVLDLDTCPDFIVGDSARLRQIAFNLLSNALKFTERGTITLRAIDEGTTMALSIEDSGIGIPADKIDLIFESFRQADAGTTRKFGGTGLGLAICRNLARAMGGEISVASVPGTGSTFTVRLPLVRGVNPDSAAASADQPVDALMILDRNPISRSMLRAMLEKRAGAVVVAASVDEAMPRLARGGFSRILVDEATIRAEPDFDIALARIGSSGVPSFLLWSSPKDADVALFQAQGIDQVIAKPIAGNILSDRLFGNDSEQKSTISGLVSKAA
ncbi:tetratricopeptide repeat-containing hybrid sensor histidine kinase/response regulator [Sphingomonas echinoides]|uniref:tetratricopeptide repeat-containing hybrid sensor histidine kinase/response regulator n=1 Tax=Sphingomonas echinoides TaxID=59803 RepID=UPI00241336AD|nr:ATP-binding protein [Sphingomonas echinoides]